MSSIINKPKGLTERTERAAFSKYDPKSKSKLAETATISLSDFERMRKNANMISQKDNHNKKKVFEEQVSIKNEAKNNLKERIKEYDKLNYNKGALSELDKENLEINKTMKQRALKIINENTDEAKEMNKLIMYAKVASIRDKQLEENKHIQGECKKFNEKMDLMMEIERLKELQLQEEREKIRKDQQYAGSLVIVDQIKERDYERLKALEHKEKEKVIMLRQVKQLEEEELRNNEIKKKQAAKLAKEVEETNFQASEIKEKRKIEEKELELKIHEYNLNKARREEEELAEKKRITEEKEREVQKMREKQERAKDKQSELDAIRAKRAYEQTERMAREKERKEIEFRMKMVQDLMTANEQQKLDKEQRLSEQAKIEKDQYDKIIDSQIKSQEEERRKEEERKKMRYDHNNELRRQMKVREEQEMQKKREELEEGRKIKQKVLQIKSNIERMKEEKLGILKAINVQEKYVTPLVKYKINI